MITGMGERFLDGPDRIHWVNIRMVDAVYDFPTSPVPGRLVLDSSTYILPPFGDVRLDSRYLSFLSLHPKVQSGTWL